MKATYGKLREKDVPVIASVVRIFKKHNLKAGLHGTSLWNPKYKDIDILVISLRNQAQKFYQALEELQKRNQAKIINQRGNETVGLDYDIKIEKAVLHVSYVVLL